MKKEYTAVGVMSGTSLDGLDIALCRFVESNNNWDFEILKADTIPYTNKWKSKLENAYTPNPDSLEVLDKIYGDYIGEKVVEFLKSSNKVIDIIASHGHTIFHQPQKKLTVQIGNGANILAKTGIKTVCDFRSLDVELGGQGAPLVPVGDRFLFSEYDYCINLGGFANISFTKDNITYAFDICPVNIVINKLANELGQPFDNNGKLAKQGSIQTELLTELNELDYYKNKAPKSLGREWVEASFLPILDKYNISVYDKLRTIYEHLAIQISKALENNNSSALFTGGGAYNQFLLERIGSISSHELIVPEKEIVEFKEALIFAFLGILRINNQINCYSSVTGAEKDSVSGVIYE